MADIWFRMNFWQWLLLLLTLVLIAVGLALRPPVPAVMAGVADEESMNIAPESPGFDATTMLARLEATGFFSPPGAKTPPPPPVSKPQPAKTVTAEPVKLPRPLLIKLVDGQYGAYFAYKKSPEKIADSNEPKEQEKTNKNMSNSKFALKYAGDLIKGWKIISISSSGIIYEKNGKTAELNLFDSEKQKF